MCNVHLSHHPDNKRDRMQLEQNSEFHKGPKKRQNYVAYLISGPLRRKESDGFLEWDVLFVLWVVKCGLVEACV